MILKSGFRTTPSRVVRSKELMSIYLSVTGYFKNRLLNSIALYGSQLSLAFRIKLVEAYFISGYILWKLITFQVKGGSSLLFRLKVEAHYCTNIAGHNRMLAVTSVAQ